MPIEPKSYEISYLINPDLPEDQAFGEAGKITSAIQDAHGLLGRIDEPRKRKLAYPIKKLREAFFGCTTFTIAPEYLLELEKRLKAEKNIIRYLVAEEVKRPRFEPRPRPVRPGGGPIRHVPTAPLGDIKPFAPAPPKEEDKMKIEELDKKLEEILGK